MHHGFSPPKIVCVEQIRLIIAIKETQICLLAITESNSCEKVSQTQRLYSGRRTDVPYLIQYELAFKTSVAPSRNFLK